MESHGSAEKIADGQWTALGCDDDGGDGIQAGLQRRADKWNPPLRTAQAATGRWLMAVCWRWEWGGGTKQLLGGLL